MKQKKYNKTSNKKKQSLKKAPETKDIEKTISVAIKCITEFEEKETPIDDFLDDYFADNYSIERKRCSSLVFSYFRNKSIIDYMVNNSAKKLTKKIRRLLVIGTTLIHFQEALHTPVIVDVIVEIAKNKFGRTKGNFVNAVMRTISRYDLAEIKEKAPKHVLYNLPKFYYTQLLKNYSVNEVIELSKIYHEIPALTLRTKETLNDETLKELELNSIKLPDWSKNTNFYKVNNAQKLFSSEFLKEGRGYIQDPSTVMAVSLLDLKGDEKIIDLCAAPGGKSIFIAEQLTDKGSLIACDRSERRLKYLKQNFETRNFKHTICCLNLLKNENNCPEIDNESFDVVIIDVPCSNTGVIRHRPDAIWRLSNKSIAKVIELQNSILKAAAKLVKKGGILLYSTCSIEKDENHNLIKNFIDNNQETWQFETELQILPNFDYDGAYGAIVRKK